MRSTAALLVALLAGPALAGPAEDVIVARGDARRLAPDAAHNALYLTGYAIRPVAVKDFPKALVFHVNQLSSQADFARPVQVAPLLWRVDIRDYGWKRDTVERLANPDPWFHTKVKTEVEETEDWGHYESGNTGRFVVTEKRKTGKKTVSPVTAARPILDPTAIIELVSLTQSQTPIVRADWFIAQTAISEGRDPGYVDFLGIKDRKDFERLVGLDEALSRRLQREIRAGLARSGVALNNRGIVRFQTITGGYWITLDSEKSTDKNNAIRLLNGDLAHDAEEIYGVLPNELFALGAFAANGTLQKTVPDKIASDHQTISNDRRIHLAKSCVACHQEGLRPINDHIRKLYRGAIKLQVVEYEDFKRKQRLYLSDLESKVKADQAVYAAALLRLNGLTPTENARLYDATWNDYVERDLMPADVAREYAVTPEVLLAGLKKYAAATGTLDPVLAGLLQEPPVPVRREHLDEAVPLLDLAMRGYVQP